MTPLFIDWNGDGNLDSQDLVTGVALDTAEKDEQDQVPSPPINANQAASGCGCAIAAIALLFFGSLVGFSLVLFL
jgi:hypothetical protein